MSLGDNKSKEAAVARDALVASLRADLTQTQAELDAQRTRAEYMTDTQKVGGGAMLWGVLCFSPFN